MDNPNPLIFDLNVWRTIQTSLVEHNYSISNLHAIKMNPIRSLICLNIPNFLAVQLRRLLYATENGNGQVGYRINFFCFSPFAIYAQS